jgi:hypothetical protein
MVRITQVDDSGADVATIVLDDFTIEILYSGIAHLLRDAEVNQAPPAPAALSGQARRRRERVLHRIQG